MNNPTQSLALKDWQALNQIKEYELSRRYFNEFIKYSWPILEPHTTYKAGYHHDCIAEHLQAATDHQISRLILNCPPRFGKSILCSVMWPLWEWAHGQPWQRHLCTSFKESLGEELSEKARRIWNSEWYQTGYCIPKNLTAVKETLAVIENSQTGYRRMSTYESATGSGGSRLIIDDPHPAGVSDEVRKRDLELFDKALSNRVSGDHNVILVVMQRLHEMDLTGHLADRGYEIVALPNEYEPRRNIITSIGWKDPRLKEGDLLWPEGFRANQTAHAKKSSTDFSYQGQYQQAPVAAKGGIIHVDKFRTWTTDTLPKDEEWDRHVISFDFSFKDTKTSDYVVGQYWRQKGSAFYLMDQIRDRMDFTTSLSQFINFCNRHPQATTRLCEETANGHAIISVLKHKLAGVIPIKAKDSKRARVETIAPLVFSGNVFIPKEADWKEDFKHEMAMAGGFGANDDQVDALCQALIYMERQGRSKGIRYITRPLF